MKEPLNCTDFENGIKYWKRTYWPRDFHNRFYAELEYINAKGQFTPKWWYSVLPYLDYWKATRPIRACELIGNARRSLSKLEEQWQTVAQFPNSIIDAKSNEKFLESFIEAVAKMKPTKRDSNVFASKICHFASPHRFPVVDNTALKKWQSKSYLQYCVVVKDAWTEISNKNKLMRRLCEEVEKNVGDELIDDYPYACKITEICLIGRGNNS